MWDELRSTWRKEGMTGMFKGNGERLPQMACGQNELAV